MSPRRKLDMRIALPPRMAMNFHGPHSPLSTCSSTPHTPMPHDFVTTPDIMTQQYREMHFDDLESISSTGSKRGREEEEEDASWTESDLTAMQNVLAHPFRPVSTPYPPGELPPPDTLDELTHQLLKYAYRPSPGKRRSRAKTPPARENEDGWTHTWEATRRKLFRFALAESQIAHGGLEDRKAPRHERVQRPGIKRMDSMDFMDQDEEDVSESDRIGRALRLSTSLQNSSKQCPLGSLTRSNSDDITTTLSSSSSTTSLASSESLTSIPSVITITPSSPVVPLPPSRRNSGGPSRLAERRTSRPSLLQRGRSFTASDLEADNDILASPGVASKVDSPTESQTTSSDPMEVIPSEELPKRRQSGKLLTIPAYVSSGPRLTRSQSTEQNLNAHAAQKSFIATRQPSTTERAALALPFDSVPSKPTHKTSNGWSDSEDDNASTALRHVKKSRAARASRTKMPMPLPMSFQPLIQSEVLAGSGLRSPFEEKSGMGF